MPATELSRTSRIVEASPLADGTLRVVVETVARQEVVLPAKDWSTTKAGKTKRAAKATVLAAVAKAVK